ncbi:MAG: cytochrome C oxidase subunit II [Deltaproteobacteria bacterium]|jgi:cytochrome c oxidase subunit 2|nr:cytochrome C oxidase subunit II [Deltaproteobacteria bacterium]
MALRVPEVVWWKPLHLVERTWLLVSAGFLLLLSASMVVWHAYLPVDNPGTSYKVAPEQFRAAAQAFIAQYRVGSEHGVAVVRPPEGGVAYLMASRFQWTPILKLKKGKTYHIYASSLDVNHGLSLLGVFQGEFSMNFQVVPGYINVLTVTPASTGEFEIICNQYCGLAHHLMSGRLIVTE